MYAVQIRTIVFVHLSRCTNGTIKKKKNEKREPWGGGGTIVFSVKYVHVRLCYFFKFFLRRTPHLAVHIKINYQTRCAHIQQRESTKDGFFSFFFLLQSVRRSVYVIIIVDALPGRPIPSSRIRRRSLFPFCFSFFSSFYFHARHVVFVFLESAAPIDRG